MSEFNTTHPPAASGDVVQYRIIRVNGDSITYTIQNIDTPFGSYDTVIRRFLPDLPDDHPADIASVAWRPVTDPAVPGDYEKLRSLLTLYALGLPEQITTKPETKGDSKSTSVKHIIRPLSAYMHFVKENRSQISDRNPTASFGEIGRIAGEEWKALSDEQKAPFELMNKKDKERYEAEKKEWEAEQAKKVTRVGWIALSQEAFGGVDEDHACFFMTEEAARAYIDEQTRDNDELELDLYEIRSDGTLQCRE